MAADVTAPHWQDTDGWHIDVRGLGPPHPMVRIRALLEKLAAEDGMGDVIVHHDREPIYLYPELAERDWNHEVVPGEVGEVRLRLWPDEAS